MAPVAEGALGAPRVPTRPSASFASVAARVEGGARRRAGGGGERRPPPPPAAATAPPAAPRLAECTRRSRRGGHDASAGERGVLQLVFDVEYLRRAFGGSDGRFATSRVTTG